MVNINDPYTSINKKKQKIIINPGVPYISSSQDDVFQLRTDEQKRSILNKKYYSSFIKLKTTKDGNEDEDKERKLEQERRTLKADAIKEKLPY